MERRQAFGRRVATQQQPQVVRKRPARPSQDTHPVQDTQFAADDIGTETYSPPPPVSESTSVDDELLEWKRARKQTIPWRPLSFTASICFGLAGFVLPDSVNNLVQWPLYALAAASFYVGIKMRRKKRELRKAEKAAAAT